MQDREWHMTERTSAKIKASGFTSQSSTSQASRMPVWCRILDDIIARALKERETEAGGVWNETHQEKQTNRRTIRNGRGYQKN